VAGIVGHRFLTIAGSPGDSELHASCLRLSAINQLPGQTPIWRMRVSSTINLYQAKSRGTSRIPGFAVALFCIGLGLVTASMFFAPAVFGNMGSYQSFPVGP
jgi:hypothetical protein